MHNIILDNGKQRPPFVITGRVVWYIAVAMIRLILWAWGLLPYPKQNQCWREFRSSTSWKTTLSSNEQEAYKDLILNQICGWRIRKRRYMLKCNVPFNSMANHFLGASYKFKIINKKVFGITSQLFVRNKLTSPEKHEIFIKVTVVLIDSFLLIRSTIQWNNKCLDFNNCFTIHFSTKAAL